MGVRGLQIFGEERARSLGINKAMQNENPQN